MKKYLTIKTAVEELARVLAIKRGFPINNPNNDEIVMTRDDFIEEVKQESMASRVGTCIFKIYYDREVYYLIDTTKDLLIFNENEELLNRSVVSLNVDVEI